jgi:hypothetical protein
VIGIRNGKIPIDLLLSKPLFHIKYRLELAVVNLIWNKGLLKSKSIGILPFLIPITREEEFEFIHRRHYADRIDIPSKLMIFEGISMRSA